MPARDQMHWIAEGALVLLLVENGFASVMVKTRGFFSSLTITNSICGLDLDSLFMASLLV